MFAQSSDGTQPSPPPLAAVQPTPPLLSPSHLASPPVTVSTTTTAIEAPRLAAVAVVASAAAPVAPFPSLAPGTRAAIAANTGTVSSLNSYVPLNVTKPPQPPSASAAAAAAPVTSPQTPAVSNGASTMPPPVQPGSWDPRSASAVMAPKHQAPDAATPLAVVGPSGDTVGSVPHINQGSGVTTPTAAQTPTQRATSSALATPAGVPAAFSANVTGQRMRPDQSQVLKDFFNSNRTPSKEEVRGLADRIGESEKKIKTWFTNQRAKEKRLTLTNPGAAPTSVASSPALPGPSHPPGWSPAPQASLKSEDDGSAHARMAVDESSDLLHAATSPPSSELHEAHAQPRPATPMTFHAPGHETERSSPPHDHSGHLVATTRDPDSDGEHAADRTGGAATVRPAHTGTTKKSGHGKAPAGAATAGATAAAQASHIVPIKVPDAFTADMLPPEAVVNVQFLMASRYFKPLGYIFSSSSSASSAAAAGQLSGATAGPTSSAAAAGADRKKRLWESDAAARPTSPADAADRAKRRRMPAAENGHGTAATGLAAPGQKLPAAGLGGRAAGRGAPLFGAGRAGEPGRARSTSRSSGSGSESGSSSGSSSSGSDSDSGSGSGSDSGSGSSSSSRGSGSGSGSSTGSSSDGSGSESEGEGGGRATARPGEASRASQASSQSDQLDHMGSIVK